MSSTERTRKLLIRSALVTGATIATLIGAQNLALVDLNQLQATLTPEPIQPEAAIPAATNIVPTPNVQRAAPSLEIVHAAPSITILRRAGDFPSNPINHQTATGSTQSIQPPVPSELAAPAPVVVQQFAPAPQPSRSTR